MSTDHHRGVFWSPDGDAVPGTLEISESGDLRVELQGQIFEGHGTEADSEVAARIEGEIADSPFPGPMITLFRCLKLESRFGAGGPVERWLAHRALIGNDIVQPEAVFERVTMSIRGLVPFMGRVNALGTPESQLIHLPDFWTEVARFTVGDWKTSFGWKAIRRGSSTSFEVRRTPLIDVELERPCSVDAVLGEVAPVFEAILTIALQAHARVEQITVSSSQERDTYSVLAPRVEGPASSGREPHESELLFRLADMPGGHALIEQVRLMFSQHPEFTAIFLGHERAPPRYVEDRMRGSVLALAHLTNLFPAVNERAREWLTSLTHAPEPIRAFLPSAALVAVPELARELLTSVLCKALGVDSRESFVEGIGLAFRWATLREGTQASGRDMLRLHHQLRALMHLALLRYLGFEPTEAERRIMRSIEARGVPL